MCEFEFYFEMVKVFLFVPDVWGSVSDWVMVFVTIVTAFYLYKTLSSQNEVLKMQNKLFEIEKVKFRESIRPKLIFTESKYKFNIEKPHEHILSIEVRSDASSDAIDIELIYSEVQGATPVVIPLGFPRQKNRISKTDLPLLFHFHVADNSISLSFIIFNVEYKDVAGAKYKQGVLCILDNNGVEIHQYIPEII